MSLQIVMKLPPGICATPGCHKPRQARDYCQACYYALRRAESEASSRPPQRWVHRISDADEETRTGICSNCGPDTKLISRGGGKWRCYPATRERSTEWKRRRRAEVRAEMSPCCDVCGGTTKLCWDHDHASMLYRGTLCNNCNTGIGMMRDDPDRLRKASEYLRNR